MWSLVHAGSSQLHIQRRRSNDVLVFQGITRLRGSHSVCYQLRMCVQAAKSNAKVEEIWQRLKGALGSDKAAKVNVVSLCNSSSQTSTNRVRMANFAF